MSKVINQFLKCQKFYLMQIQVTEYLYHRKVIDMVANKKATGSDSSLSYYTCKHPMTRELWSSSFQIRNSYVYRKHTKCIIKPYSYPAVNLLIYRPIN